MSGPGASPQASPERRRGGGARGAPEGELDPAALEALLEARPRAWLRRVPGRETFAWPAPGAAPGPGWIVKRFAGDAWGEALADLLATGRRRSPARRERDNLLGLAQAGLGVPRPLGLLERGPRSLLVMECVPHRETLAARLARAARPERRRLGARLAELVARLHGRGWFHRDLYLVHWILAEPAPGEREALVLIDVGRARRRRRPRRRWWIKDLAALAHSAPAAVGERERRAFLLRYLGGRGFSASLAPAWARAVERRRARMDRHEPRHDAASRRWSAAEGGP